MGLEIAGWIIALILGGAFVWAFTRIQKLEQLLKQSNAQNQELSQKVTLALEDRDATVQRVKREAERQSRFGHEPLLKGLLPVLDNLDRAIEAASGDGEGGILGGVRMVEDQLLCELKRHGVTPIDARGAPFDPREHEAVQEAPTHEHPPGHVVAQWQRGYRLHDRLLRPARVVVATEAPAHDGDAAPLQGSNAAPEDAVGGEE